MKRRSFLSAAVLTAALSAIAAPAAFAQDAEFYFIDLLQLQEGKTSADAAAYFEAIEPIVAEHGLVRALPSFNIMQRMSGDLDADLLNIWTVTDPEATFAGIFDDEAYLNYVETRNSTFDMQNSTMFMLVPNS